MTARYTAELNIARLAAMRAGEEVLKLYETLTPMAEAPADISTEADRRAQQLILETLTRSFPGDAYCAEETEAGLAGLERQGPRLWIIDPIDGTRGFVKKLGQFSIMIGLVEEGRPRVAVVLEPARRRLTYAIAGAGCWAADGADPANREALPCRVSSVASWEQSRIVRSHSEKTCLSPRLRQVERLDYTYSAGIKMAMVARGEAELYLSTYAGFNAWDVCAGQLLVEEAGGRVTDAHGREIRYADDGSGKIAGTIASNGLLHEAGRQCLADFLAR
jgi:3'(2'), 5'-bisphosphate nucleotidase